MKSVNRWRMIGGVCAAVMVLSGQATAQTKPTLLSDIQIKEDDTSIQLMFSTSRTIPVECYDLTSPPQIVIDFMGEIYSNRPDEIITVNSSGVRQLRIVRGTRQSVELDPAFYGVDFIIIDLDEPQRYRFEQGLTNSVLVISKPGKDLPAEKPVMPEPVAPPPPVVERPVMQEQELEISKPMPVASVADDELPTMTEDSSISASVPEKELPRSRRRTARSAADTASASPEKASFWSKVPFFGSSHRATDAESRRQSVKKEEKKDAPEKKRTLFGRRARKESPQSQTEQPAAAHANSASSRAERQLNSAQEEKKRKDAIVDEYVSALQAARDAVTQAEAAYQKTADRLKVSQFRLSQARDDREASLQDIELKKNAANVAYQAYAQAKDQMSVALQQTADETELQRVQKEYEAAKQSLETAIQEAETAKQAGNEKLMQYTQVQKEIEALELEGDAPARLVEQAKAKREEIENKLKIAMQDAVEAGKNVEIASTAYKQYELEQAEAEYRKSLAAIDSSLLKSMEEEERQKQLEAERKEKERMLAKQLEDERKAQEQMAAAAEAAEKAEKQKMLEAAQKDEAARTTRKRSRRGSQQPTQKKAATPEISQNAIELRNAGLEMQRRGDLDSAMKYYQQALLKEPDFATVHNDLGILYEQKGFNDKAKSEYMAALKTDPTYTRAHSNLALLYEKLQEYDKAYYHWKQRVQFGDPADPWTQKAQERINALEKQR